jgi:hypothetical protein
VSGLVFVEQRPMRGRVVALHAGDAIGRGDCEIVAPDPEVSRRHAELHDHPGGLAIADAGSLNGTFVNGVRIAGRTPLGHGDVVRAGNTVWHVAAAGNAGADGLPAVAAALPGATLAASPN